MCLDIYSFSLDCPEFEQKFSNCATEILSISLESTVRFLFSTLLLLLLLLSSL